MSPPGSYSLHSVFPDFSSLPSSIATIIGPCPAYMEALYAILLSFSPTGEPGDVVELLSAVYERVNATGRGLRSAGLAAAASFDLDGIFGLALHS